MIRSEGSWPFSFVGQVGETKYSYRPRSGFLCLVRNYPFLFIEICSDRNRMLLQAGLLVRVMNSFKTGTTVPFNSFIAVAIYITPSAVAERYLVYQPARDEKEVRTINVLMITDLCSSYSFLQIKYVSDHFDLKVPSGTFKFFFELHNLPSVLPPDTELDNASSHLHRLQEQVQKANLTEYNGQNADDQAPGDNASRLFDNPSIARQLSDAELQVQQDTPIPGWTRLDGVRSFLEFYIYNQ